ncbi:MAG TPA: alanine racemase [Nocardioidaceae bacterium]|nr:alanine racemase [Nocardioidaceae bacterium]
MPLTLYVDGPRWRDHLRSVADATPGLVPVAKGNGYGFTVAGLARRADWLGVDTVAVGTYGEIEAVDRRFTGDVMVLEPWRPFLDPPSDRRLVHTIGRLDDLAAIAASSQDRPRVVLEALTSMRRHGLTEADLRTAFDTHPGVLVDGLALHLPLGGGHVEEVDTWLRIAQPARCYLSHVAGTELDALRIAHHDVEFRPRVGTSLWLGDRDALSPRSTVLDVHAIGRGDRVGYRQRRTLRDGHLIVVSGGTAHGIALEAPAAADTARQRAISLAKGSLEATGRALSPFSIGGRQRWFAEPPHMQVSLLFLPSSVEPPSIGDEIPVDVRLTTTTFDRINIS